MGDKQGLLGAADVRALAGRLGIRPTKTLGQNFVIDANTVRRIVRAADLRADDVVIEVGPGLGSLTLALLPEARRVVAVEIDPVLAAELPATAAAREPDLAGRLEVVRADAMKITAVPGPEPTALVANLPYNVAVPVVLHLLAALPSLRRALVMVQAEVADRMVAAPGSKIYGVPSVKLAWYGEARRAGPVGRAVFWPVPNVDSGLVAFTRRDPPDTTAPRAEVFAVIDAAFAQRRKTLRAALAGWAGSAAAAERALRAAGVDPQARGEAIDVASFARIAEYGPVSDSHCPPTAAPGGASHAEEAEGDGEGAFADGAGRGTRGGADRDHGAGGAGRRRLR
ncbi:16S rRNA (adenine(1518)-N(6)/adenine(1519)-N(6))-dimethyltransferase RsmA [Actinomadura terrae]|uniref:16S rRNA (adenine(1518)-N(6)/adenine(1519)-N(6))- dimethyltransferase RsmA n=1 Tax=Actinomadura terrae TaxID=604353 RepID=UPI001FA7B91F|nr:16S rRNA (adenine(1518)-N(6)/adenine(1519)-N(6))-dimethyltransferase RsmA [Actinomadura terrae]